jgi:hypothetical protein
MWFGSIGRIRGQEPVRSALRFPMQATDSFQTSYQSGNSPAIVDFQNALEVQL